MQDVELFLDLSQKQLVAILSGEGSATNFIPEEPIASHETAIGILEDVIARELWSMSIDLKKKMEGYIVEHRLNDVNHCRAMNGRERSKHLGFVSAIDSLFVSVSTLLRARIRARFPHTVDPNLLFDVREGWQVVIWKKNPILDIVDWAWSRRAF